MEEIIIPAEQQEADDIIKNSDNPKHQLFWNSDKGTVAYVEALYQKAHPGETDISDLSVGGSGMEKLSTEAPAPEFYPEKEAALENLKTIWGPEYESKLSLAQEAGEFVNQSYPDLVEKVIDMGLGNDPKIAEAMVLIGERLRK